MNYYVDTFSSALRVFWSKKDSNNKNNVHTFKKDMQHVDGHQSLTDRKNASIAFMRKLIQHGKNLPFNDVKKYIDDIDQKNKNSNIWSHCHYVATGSGNTGNKRNQSKFEYSILHYAFKCKAFCHAICIIMKDPEALKVRDSAAGTPLRFCDSKGLKEFWKELLLQYKYKNINEITFNISANAILVEIFSNDSMANLNLLAKEILTESKLSSPNLKEILLCVVKSSDLDMLKHILNKEKDCKKIGVNTSIGYAVFVEAINCGNTAVVEYLLQENKDSKDSCDKKSVVSGAIDCVIGYEGEGDRFTMFKESIDKQDMQRILTPYLKGEEENDIAFSENETSIISSISSNNSGSSVKEKPSVSEQLKIVIQQDYDENKPEYVHNTKKLLNDLPADMVLSDLKHQLSLAFTDCQIWHSEKDHNLGKRYRSAEPYMQCILKAIQANDDKCRVIMSSLNDFYYDKLCDGKKLTDASYHDSRILGMKLLCIYSNDEKNSSNEGVTTPYYLSQTVQNIIKIKDVAKRDEILHLFLDDIKVYNTSPDDANIQIDSHEIFKYVIDNTIKAGNYYAVIQDKYFRKFCRKESLSLEVLEAGIHSALIYGRTRSLTALMQVIKQQKTPQNKHESYGQIFQLLATTTSCFHRGHKDILGTVIIWLEKNEQLYWKQYEDKLICKACEFALPANNIGFIQHKKIEISYACLNDYLQIALLQSRKNPSLVLVLLNRLLTCNTEKAKKQDSLKRAQECLDQHLKDHAEDKEEDKTDGDDIAAVNFLLKSATLLNNNVDGDNRNVDYKLLSNALREAGTEKNFDCMFSLLESVEHFDVKAEELLKNALEYVIKDATAETSYKQKITVMLNKIRKLGNFKSIDMGGLFGTVSLSCKLSEDLMNAYQPCFSLLYTPTRKIPEGSDTSNRRITRSRSRLMSISGVPSTFTRSRDRVNSASAYTPIIRRQQKQQPPQQLDFDKLPTPSP